MGKILAGHPDSAFRLLIEQQYNNLQEFATGAFLTIENAGINQIPLPRGLAAV